MTTTEIGAAMPDLALRTLDGGDERELRLSAFWRERPLFVVFLRHFG